MSATIHQIRDYKRKPKPPQNLGELTLQFIESLTAPVYTAPDKDPA